jgi:WD40 repeat protein
MNQVGAPPRSPFKGLSEFDDSELDALLFFGRERECEVIVANAVATRFTVLYGDSGVGKSSVLRAGVVRRLRVLEPDALVVLLDSWSEDASATLDRARRAESAYLILDQFEEYFLYHGDGDGKGMLLYELPELMHENPRVNVLISLREDSLAQLDAFKAGLPAVFANQLRLEHLDREAARAAILGPVARWNELTGESMEVEPLLVEAVLDEVAGVAERGGRIEAPYLQLVLERLWEEERAAGSQALQLSTLRALGGAETIVREHLERALDVLDAHEKDVAASMFDHLVTPSGTKVAHRVSDLAEYASVPGESLLPVLMTLSRERIIRTVDGSDRYEIFHDVLGESIRAWCGQWRLERERAAARRRHRRLVVVTALAFVALAIVAGLAAWALSERSSAQSQARQARGRQFQAMALQQLATDPNQGLHFALAAARLESGRSAEAVLRQALVADRLRLVRHTRGPVRAVAASPRGDLIAAAVAPGSVLLLDARNRRLIRTLPPRGAVDELSFDPGGRTLVAVSPTGVAHVWDVRTGRMLPRGLLAGARAPDGGIRLVPLRGLLKQTIAHARRLSVAPAGDLVAAVVAEKGGGAQPWIFDRDGRLLRILSQKGIRDVTFSPDGQLLATASADGRTILWDPRTGRIVRPLLDAKHGANAVAFSPDGTLVATGGADSGVRIWTVATGEHKYLLLGHTNPVSALVWSPDGHVVATSSPDNTVKLWRVQALVGSGSLAATLMGSGAPVRALAFSADSARLVTGGEDRTVRVWDARPDEQLDLLGRAPGAALAARWAADTIVGLWSSGVVKTFDVRTRRVRHVLHGKTRSALTALGVSRSASVVAAGGVDGTTDVWNGRTGAVLSRPVGPTRVTAVSVAPNGRLVASGDRRGVVRVWRPHGGALVWSAHQGGEVLDLAFSSAGDRLVSAGPQGSVVWSAADGRRLETLRSPKADVRAAFSPDGTLVATAGADGNGRVWFARTGTLYRVLRGHKHALTDVAFSGDGRLLATSSKDSDGRIWDVGTGLGHVLERRAFGPVASIAFDATGRWVVAAGPISAIIWNVATGQPLFYLRGHTLQPTGVSFAPRTATVLSSSRDGTIRTYRCEVCVDLPALVHLARHRLAQTR